jgi:hypothetical protein
LALKNCKTIKKISINERLFNRIIQPLGDNLRRKFPAAYSNLKILKNRIYIQ